MEPVWIGAGFSNEDADVSTLGLKDAGRIRVVQFFSVKKM